MDDLRTALGQQVRDDPGPETSSGRLPLVLHVVQPSDEGAVDLLEIRWRNCATMVVGLAGEPTHVVNNEMAAQVELSRRARLRQRPTGAKGPLRHNTYGGGVLLEPLDPLPRRPQRVLVAGASGAGKTSLAARLGQALELPHVEIDSLFHGPDWTPRDSFVGEVEAFSAQSLWITEWQYSSVRALLAERADLLVWLDLPKATVMRQVIARSVRRRTRRQVLWNGNVEPPLWTFFTDPKHIIRWAWTTHSTTSERVAALQGKRPELCIVRLRTWREVQRWLAGAVRTAA